MLYPVTDRSSWVELGWFWAFGCVAATESFNFHTKLPKKHISSSSKPSINSILSEAHRTDLHPMFPAFHIFRLANLKHHRPNRLVSRYRNVKKPPFFPSLDPSPSIPLHNPPTSRNITSVPYTSHRSIHRPSLPIRNASTLSKPTPQTQKIKPRNPLFPSIYLAPPPPSTLPSAPDKASITQHSVRTLHRRPH